MMMIMTMMMKCVVRCHWMSRWWYTAWWISSFVYSTHDMRPTVRVVNGR